ncbi:hypothetical protein DFS34DRAFT_621510 [Phlyctochytrium arcticum]|nr:hypothetical protein DFS34DRAFT_621510 [Phlyctochytrium arcticum]
MAQGESQRAQLDLVYAEIVNVTSALRKNRRWQNEYEESKAKQRPDNPPYSYCLDALSSGYAHLQHVLEFTSSLRPTELGLDASYENPLLQSFARLKARLSLIDDINQLSPSDLLDPFLEVIRSGDTTGPITGAALSSVEKFIAFSILNLNHPSLPTAMAALTYSVTRCKFEATDTVSDEAVLLKILALSTVIITSDAGQACLDDKGICEMVEVAFGMYFQPRVSELLRRHAEQTLIVLVQSLFSRLGKLVDFTAASSERLENGHTAFPEVQLEIPNVPTGDLSQQQSPEHVYAHDMSEQTTAISMFNSHQQTSGTTSPHGDLTGAVSSMAAGLESDQAAHMGQEVESLVPNQRKAQEGQSMDTPISGTSNVPVELDEERVIFQPYGLPAFLEMLRVLTSLIDPKNRLHTDSLHRTIALRLLASGFEIGGASLAKLVAHTPNYGQGERPTVLARELITNDLCRYLFTILQNNALPSNSGNNESTTTLLGLALRCSVMLFQHMRRHLKLQLEWFLQWLLSRLDAGVVAIDLEEVEDGSTMYGRSPPVSYNVRSGVVQGETRELLLECIAQLCRIPGFWGELYVNFDGDMDQQSHLFEELLVFLAKHSLPDVTPGGAVTNLTHQTVCLESLLLFLSTLGRSSTQLNVDSSIRADASEEDETVDVRSLAENKARKRVLKEGADLFNTSPKDGIAFLQAKGFLSDPLPPQELAVFLKSTHGVNKRLLGEYLSKAKNSEILEAFVALHDFRNKRFDEALRLLLGSFRLPGESQQIERIVQVFATAFFTSTQEQEAPAIISIDGTFVLSYAVIMLNTDLYNPQNRRKMTLEEFVRNLRGLNGGQDFPSEYLGEIYSAIRENEIVMPEEHEGDLGFDYQWKELIRRSSHTGILKTLPTNTCSGELLSISSKLVVSALSYALDNVDNYLTFEKVILGYHHCVTAAAEQHMSDIVDELIVSLAKMTGLLRIGRVTPQSPIGSASEDNLTVRVVDPWRLDIGRNIRGQVAAVLLFNLTTEYGTCLRNGWQVIIRCLKNLFLHRLLSEEMVLVDDFVRGKTSLFKVLEEKSAVRQASSASSGRRKELGLLSTLSNFLAISSGGDDLGSREPNAEEVRYDDRALHCIRACRIENIFDDSRFFEDNVLLLVVDTIIHASFVENDPVERVQKSGGSRVADDESLTTAGEPSPTSETPESKKVPKFDPSAVYLLEILFHVSIQNRDRIACIWEHVSQHVQFILSDAGGYSSLLHERAVTGTIQLLRRIGNRAGISVDIFSALAPLVHNSPESFKKVVVHLSAGLTTLMKTNPESVSANRPSRDLLVKLLTRATDFPIASSQTFQAATYLVGETGQDTFVTQENFSDCVDLLSSFVPSSFDDDITSIRKGKSGGANVSESATLSASGSFRHLHKDTPQASRSPEMQLVVDRALMALEKIGKLQHQVPHLVGKDGKQQNRVFFEFWLPILSSLGQQTTNPIREIRQLAITQLQKVILSSELESGCWSNSNTISADCFENVLFPMLDTLLNPEVARIDPIGMEETRVRVAALLSKSFLHFLAALQGWTEFPDLWLRILDYMRRVIQISETEYSYEGIQELLKNIILVMSHQGIIQPTSPPGTVQAQMWDITRGVLDPILPNLLPDLFRPQHQPQPSEPAADPAPTQALESLIAQAMAITDPDNHEQHPPVKEVPVEGGSVIMQEDS